MEQARQLVGKARLFLGDSNRRSYVLLVVGFLFPLIWFAVEFEGEALNKEAAKNLRAGAFTTSLIAFYWMTETLPIAVTALLPVILFPILGVTTAKTISAAYFNDTIFLMLGSFLFAVSMERWNLHRKLALKFLLLIGERPRVMMAGFMIITAFLSMWISNTATTSMMTPLVLAVLGQLSRDRAAEEATALEHSTRAPEVDEPIPLDGEGGNDMETFDSPNNSDASTVELDLMHASTNHPSRTSPAATAEDHLRFSKACLLGIAYAASIGGTSTLVGTGTNVILVQSFSKLFPSAPPISFGGWFLFATPLAMLLLAVSFGLLILLFTRGTQVQVSRVQLEIEHERVGPFNWAQLVLICDLILMVTFWFLRPIVTNAGWLRSGYITDGTISMMAGLILFIIPSRQEAVPGESLESPVHVIDGGDRLPQHLDSRSPTAAYESKEHRKVHRLADNETLLDVPWDIVMLLGGGLALAEGFQASGLSVVLAHRLNGLSAMPLYFMIMLISLIVLFTTELTSNIATVTLVLPILAAMAQSTHQHPLLLMIPAAICSSLAFMLPVATPPNAIVFSSNILKVVDMAKAGFTLNLLSLLLVPLYMLSFGSLIFGINFKEFPEWAQVITLVPAPTSH